MNVLKLTWLSLFLVATVAAGDWRPEFLAEEGLGSTRAEWEQAIKAYRMDATDLEAAYRRLGSEEYSERERAQSELLLGGPACQGWLRSKAKSPDPEVRMRVAEILDVLEFPAKNPRTRMIQHALDSLLKEPEGKPDAATGGVFYEWFGTDAADLEKGYRQFGFEAGTGMTGKVEDSRLVFFGNRNGDGDQRLILSSGAWPGTKKFPKEFNLSVRLGGTQGGQGAWHLGVAIGRVRVLYHPGYVGGGFRLEEVGTGKTLSANKNMGFTPSTTALQRMRVKVRHLGDGSAELAVTVEQDGDAPFEWKQSVPAGMMGPMDQISLDRSGRSGGDACFEELVIDRRE